MCQLLPCQHCEQEKLGSIQTLLTLVFIIRAIYFHCYGNEHFLPEFVRSTIMGQNAERSSLCFASRQVAGSWMSECLCISCQISDSEPYWKLESPDSKNPSANTPRPRSSASGSLEWVCRPSVFQSFLVITACSQDCESSFKCRGLVAVLQPARLQIWAWWRLGRV